MFKKLIIYNVLALINPNIFPFSKMEDPSNPFSSIKNVDGFMLQVKNDKKEFNEENFLQYLSIYLFQIGFEYWTNNDLILLILYLSFSKLHDFDENLHIEKTLIILEEVYNNHLSDYVVNGWNENILKIAFDKIDILVNSLSIQECSLSLLLINLFWSLFNVESNLYINKTFLNYTKKEFNLINIDSNITNFIKSCKKFILNIKKHSYSQWWLISILDYYYIIKVLNKINIKSEK